MLNIQDLETIKSLNLNVFIFLTTRLFINKQTQKNFFCKENGSSPNSD